MDPIGQLRQMVPKKTSHTISGTEEEAARYSDFILDEMIKRGKRKYSYKSYNFPKRIKAKYETSFKNVYYVKKRGDWRAEMKRKGHENIRMVGFASDLEAAINLEWTLMGNGRDAANYQIRKILENSRNPNYNAYISKVR